MSILTTTEPTTNAQRLADWKMKKAIRALKQCGATLEEMSKAFATVGEAGISLANHLRKHQSLLAVRPVNRINLATKRPTLLSHVRGFVSAFLGWLVVLAVAFGVYMI